MQTLYSGENAGGNTVGVLIMKKNKNMVCTREFALEEVEKHITNAIHWSIKASMDEHFISDLKHLYSVANANRICADKKSATENAMQA